jgi:hypothetical protein
MEIYAVTTAEFSVSSLTAFSLILISGRTADFKHLEHNLLRTALPSSMT